MNKTFKYREEKKQKKKSWLVLFKAVHPTIPPSDHSTSYPAPPTIPPPPGITSTTNVSTKEKYCAGVQAIGYFESWHNVGPCWRSVIAAMKAHGCNEEYIYISKMLQAS